MNLIASFLATMAIAVNVAMLPWAIKEKKGIHRRMIWASAMLNLMILLCDIDILTIAIDEILFQKKDAPTEHVLIFADRSSDKVL